MLARNSGNRRRAQGMTEYIIIVALVAVALITVVTLFGNKVKMLFASSVQSIDDGVPKNPPSVFEEKTIKDKFGDEAKKENIDKAHTLKNFKSSGD